jgi:hypothetical protein
MKPLPAARLDARGSPSPRTNRCRPQDMGDHQRLLGSAQDNRVRYLNLPNPTLLPSGIRRSRSNVKSASKEGELPLAAGPRSS